MKWKSLFVLLLGLIAIGSTIGNVEAYEDLGFNRAIKTVSDWPESARVDEMVFLYGEYPVIYAGSPQTLSIGSFTGINNEPACGWSGGCFIPKNKKIEISQEAGPTGVEYSVWWVGADSGNNNVPDKVEDIINGLMKWMFEIIIEKIPYASDVVNLVKLFTKEDHTSTPIIVMNTRASFNIGDFHTGAVVLHVRPTDTGKLERGKMYDYTIKVSSTTQIWFYQRSSWTFREYNSGKVHIIPDFSSAKYVSTVSVATTYTLKVIVP